MIGIRSDIILTSYSNRPKTLTAISHYVLWPWRKSHVATSHTPSGSGCFQFLQHCSTHNALCVETVPAAFSLNACYNYLLLTMFMSPFPKKLKNKLKTLPIYSLLNVFNLPM